jgi:hypothetical protein
MKLKFNLGTIGALNSVVKAVNKHNFANKAWKPITEYHEIDTSRMVPTTVEQGPSLRECEIWYKNLNLIKL